jgi:hypothetical protein
MKPGIFERRQNSCSPECLSLSDPVVSRILKKDIRPAPNMMNFSELTQCTSVADDFAL